MTVTHSQPTVRASGKFPRRPGLKERPNVGTSQRARAHSHRRRALPHLFRHWEEVRRSVRTARCVKLFIDFDGTLVDLRPRPDQVKIRPAAQLALRKLIRHRRVEAMIVSGRRREALIKFVRVRGVRYMGLYGWEDAAVCHLPQRVVRTISRARAALAGLPKELPGIYVEDKGISLAIHFRGASLSMQRRVRSRICASLEPFQADLDVLRAKHVWEVVPRQVSGKGAAIRRALKRVRTAFLPIYIGDDLTDESAFAALRQGITVLVGPARHTHAQFRLRNPQEVCDFLKKLEAELP
jgi:trehalose-phosphatase